MVVTLNNINSIGNKQPKTFVSCDNKVCISGILVFMTFKPILISESAKIKVVADQGVGMIEVRYEDKEGNDILNVKRAEKSKKKK